MDDLVHRLEIRANEILNDKDSTEKEQKSAYMMHEAARSIFGLRFLVKQAKGRDADATRGLRPEDCTLFNQN